MSYIHELTLKHACAGTAPIESGALLEACSEVDSLRAALIHIRDTMKSIKGARMIAGETLSGKGIFRTKNP